MTTTTLEGMIIYAEAQGASREDVIEMLQRKARTYFEKGEIWDLKKILDMGIQVEFSKGVVQQAYARLMWKGWLGYWKLLEEITGVKAALPGEEIQGAYETFLPQEKGIGYAKVLYDFTRVRPRKSTLREAIDICLQEDRPQDAITLSALAAS